MQYISLETYQEKTTIVWSKSSHLQLEEWYFPGCAVITACIKWARIAPHRFANIQGCPLQISKPTPRQQAFNFKRSKRNKCPTYRFVLLTAVSCTGHATYNMKNLHTKMWISSLLSSKHYPIANEHMAHLISTHFTHNFTKTSPTQQTCYLTDLKWIETYMYLS